MLGVASALAQISPGPLAKAHSILSGSGHCTECHDIGKRNPEFKCLDCHRDIRERLQQKRGLHPSLVGADQTSNGCIRCHSDHNGRDFELIRWDTPVRSFDHHRAGYTLEGKHARIDCRECHTPAHISAAAKESISVKNLERTWLGLSTKCEGCHTDPHRGQLAHECSSCHDSLDWKNATQYDHNRARFRLTGGHLKVACEKCHTKVEDPKPYVKYKGIAFEDCTPCHSDPHKGTFRAACRTCHTSTSSWRPNDITQVFDHSKTRYPLEGKHAALACESCHRRGGNFKEPVAFAHCTDCHKKDPHGGQFAARAEGGDCAACHKVSGFKPSTFSVAQHAGTQFPLKAKHVQVACEKCHVMKAQLVVYRFQDTSCAACHKDVHDGQFRDAPYRNRCESCHNESGFRPSTFTLVEHSATRFPLEGAHLAVVCNDCHRQPAGSDTVRAVRYIFDVRTCTGCHEDPHKGEFATRMMTLLADGSSAGCRACHSTKTWHELQGFDHEATDFPLEGAHRAVQCGQCHKPDNLTTDMKNVVYRSAPKQCSGCHEDIHGGQFTTGTQPADCARCHKVLKWRPSTFDHNTQSTYKLDGAHREVRCALCHTTTKEVAGKVVVFYKPTPRECSACHGSEIAGK